MKKLFMFLIVVLISGIVFYSVYVLFGEPQTQTYYRPHHHSTMFHGGFMVVFWLIVFLLIYTGFESFSTKKDADSAQRIIDERYARGEIDKTTYMNLQNTLKEKKQ